MALFPPHRFSFRRPFLQLDNSDSHRISTENRQRISWSMSDDCKIFSPSSSHSSPFDCQKVSYDHAKA
ncbi:hypothetical protein HMPREF3226_02706 [Prevotella corporis]|uniref:Uncharacterized protein n=1 Tax=Prevotella corporis TaxID=28128 RepID=A0A133PTQ6_9BACT|nr:hypothetical protein HMPREF3226_02706 [Prevotella corporis]